MRLNVPYITFMQEYTIQRSVRNGRIYNLRMTWYVRIKILFSLPLFLMKEPWSKNLSYCSNKIYDHKLKYFLETSSVRIILINFLETAASLPVSLLRIIRVVRHPLWMIYIGTLMATIKQHYSCIVSWIKWSWSRWWSVICLFHFEGTAPTKQVANQFHQQQAVCPQQIHCREFDNCIWRVANYDNNYWTDDDFNLVTKELTLGDRVT